MKIDISNLKFQLRPDSQFANVKNVEPNPFLAAAIQIILVIASIAFFFMLVLSGFQWITSNGNPQKIEDAKKRITASVIGLIIVFGVFAFTYMINAFFGVSIGGLGIGPTPVPGGTITPPACFAPALTSTRTCNGNLVNTTWTWNQSPTASNYRLQVDNNSNFSSPEVNIVVNNVPYFWNDQISRTYYGRVRVENYTNSCSEPGVWSNTEPTDACIAPPPTNPTDSCQCDWNGINGTWVVTINNCNIGNSPVCTGSSINSCRCIPTN